MIPFLPRVLEVLLLWAACVWLAVCVALCALLGVVLAWDVVRPRREHRLRRLV